MKHSWQDVILDEFVPQLARLTLVADPDGLVAEESIQETLRDRGFELVPYQDSIAFRYLYESTYRPRWEEGDTTELIILLRTEQPGLNNLPYDLLNAGRQLSFSLSELFPKLTYNEVAALEHADLDRLYQAQGKHGASNLGENATRDFILRHVFGISADLIKNDADLLTLLLRLHFSGRQLPTPFAERLVQQLHQRNGFVDWPLQELLSDSTVLFEFLQERWPIYLNQEAGRKDTLIYETASTPTYALKWEGPRLLPFDKPDIRAFVDTLFLEGKLRPVKHPLAEKLKDLWVIVGLKQDPVDDQLRRLSGLLDRIEKRIPQSSASHQEWLSFAPTWAEAVGLYSNVKLEKAKQKQIRILQEAIDTAFQEWLIRRYHSLATRSPHPPVMVHHIPQSLARKVMDSAQEKVALIVMDGLAFDQWLNVRETLNEQLPGIHFHQSAVFAWIPTITSVSRQAIFSGDRPFFFPGSITTTIKEPNLWSVFWENKGLSANAIGYEKTLRADSDLERVDQLLSRPYMRVVGLVVDQIDYMMHGITLGLRGLHQQIKLWLEGKFLSQLFELLWHYHYQIYLTADHGNIAAEGVGQPNEGFLADSKGQRVRIYSNQTLLESVHQNFPEAISWPPAGLPANFFPLIAPNRKAFTTARNITVSHGGFQLEEVIVPYVKVERK